MCLNAMSAVFFLLFWLWEVAIAEVWLSQLCTMKKAPEMGGVGFSCASNTRKPKKNTRNLRKNPKTL